MQLDDHVLGKLGQRARTQRRMDRRAANAVLDLLGVPAVLRDCSTDLPTDATLEYKKDVVAEKLELLENERDTYLYRLDAEERGDAMKGNSFDTSDAAERLRRYDAMNQRTFFRVLGQFLSRLREFRKRAQAARRAAESRLERDLDEDESDSDEPIPTPQAKAPANPFTREKLASILESLRKPDASETPHTDGRRAAASCERDASSGDSRAAAGRERASLGNRRERRARKRRR